MTDASLPHWRILAALRAEGASFAGNVWLRPLLFTLLLLGCNGLAAENRFAVPQWQSIDLEFTAARDHLSPLDVRFFAQARGPGGVNFELPGFWDGERNWKLRFTPTVTGLWELRTRCDGVEDEGICGRVVALDALPARSENPLFAHGGFLNVSENRRFLTYSDGTPFFWLGDTWWFCPSELCAVHTSSSREFASTFRTLVELRSAQGFTVVQVALLGRGGVVSTLRSPASINESDLAVWRHTEEALRSAIDAGLLPVLALGFHKSIDRLGIEDLRAYWRYAIARFGALPVTWMILGEYNLHHDAARIDKVLKIGGYIKEMDPYPRAMSLHPWTYSSDKRQAWNEAWLDFIMVQGGHDPDRPPPAGFYREAYGRRDRKPIVEAEARYEGIAGMGDADVRLAAYAAMQSGASGYTYGAHGLWYPNQDAADRRYSEYGPPKPWWEAMRRPGAGHLRVFREFYESLPWWRMEPRVPLEVTSAPGRTASAYVTSDGDRRIVAYYPRFRDPAGAAYLRRIPKGTEYVVRWISPIDGSTTSGGLVSSEDGELRLPAPPGTGDWLLVLEARQQLR